MKPSLLSILLIGLFIIPIPPVVAQDDSELEWGVEVGDEITYVLQRKYLDDQFGQMFSSFIPFITEIDEGQKVIARVDYLPPIDENFTTGFFGGSNCTIIRENDSEVLMEDMPMLLVPLGIWNVEVEPEESNVTTTTDVPGGPNGGMPGSFEIYNTTDEWGTVMNGEMWFTIILITFHLEILYYKANGTLSKMSIRMDMSGNPSIDVLFAQWRPNMATIIPMPLPIIPIIIYSSIGIVIVLIIYLIWRRRRRRKIVTE